MRQSRPAASPTKPPAGPRSNEGTSKATGRGSGLLFSHSSLLIFAFLTLKMPNPANTDTYRGNPLNEVRLLYTMRPLTPSWIDEACLTTNSVHPPSHSPTLPCLVSEHTVRSPKPKPGTEAPAEMFTLPVIPVKESKLGL